MLRSTKRALVLALVALAACLAATVFLGPIGSGAIAYHHGETLANQVLGLEAVAIGLVTPLALAAARLVQREWLLGPVLAFVPGVFAMYAAPQYVIGPDYLGLPGNNERFVLLHVALLVLGVLVTVLAWQQVDRIHLLPATRRSDRQRMAVLFGLAALVVARWTPLIAALTAADVAPARGLVDHPTAYLLAAVLDLGLVLPATVAAALGLRAGAVWARSAAYAVFAFFATVPLGVAVGALAMVRNGDPRGSVAAVVGFGVVAVASVLGVAVLYRPLLRERVSIVPPEWSLEHHHS